LTAQPTTRPATNTIRKIAVTSIVVAFVVMGIKYLAYLATGSVAFYSDALESIVNVVVSMVALYAITLAAKPADENHPFGHHKAELFSAAFEGAMIIVAALLIFREAYDAFITPRAIEAPVTGLLINGAATVINAGWSMFLINRGRALHSPALKADGQHLLTDVWTSVGVFAGISLAVITGWNILDPLLAFAVGVNIIWSGHKIIYHSLSSLMDEAVPDNIMEKITSTIRSQGHGALQAHDIRTRQAGPITFIEFHLIVSGEMTVNQAHEICDRIENQLEKEIANTDVVIHVEPEYMLEAHAKDKIDF
jgi:cation diffusion facilitator family transporter